MELYEALNWAQPLEQIEGHFLDEEGNPGRAVKLFKVFDRTRQEYVWVTEARLKVIAIRRKVNADIIA